ncbi:MAG: Cof-type HAD-IIB family hydrolase [Eubacteriales bacterium]
MNTKIFFFDIDGTLLDESGVSESTIKCLRLLKEKGHKIFICTGRSRSMIPEELVQGLGFHGVVAGCGLYGEYLEEIRYNIELSQQQVKNAIERLERHKTLYIFEGRECLYYNDTIEDGEEKPFIIQMVEKQMKGNLLKIGTFNGPIIANKFSSILYEADEKKFYQEFEDEYAVQIHSSKMAEFILKGHSKATGIHKMCQILGASVEDTVCFGDSVNDIEMLEHCQIGICMGNGSAIAKEHADYVTGSIQEDGIYHACKHFDFL